MDFVANPRLQERGDGKATRRRPFVGVGERHNEFRERLPPLGAGAPGSGIVGDDVADDVVECLFRLLDADLVGRLVAEEDLHPPKNPEVEGLGEV